MATSGGTTSDSNTTRTLHLSRADSRPSECEEWAESGAANETLSAMASAFSTLIHSLGEDPNREGLRKTPMRAAKAFCYFTKGYEETVHGKR